MQFKLTFALSEPLTLPLSYHSALQGMIYHVLSDAPEFSAFLHDDGYTRNRRAYKLFVFGPLEGPYRVRDGRITFPGPLSLEVRSPGADFCRVFSDAIAKSGAVTIAQRRLRVECEIRDFHIGADSVGVRMDADSVNARLGADSVGVRMDADSVGARMDADSVGVRMDADSVGVRMDADFVNARLGADSVGVRMDADSVGVRLDADSVGVRMRSPLCLTRTVDDGAKKKTLFLSPEDRDFPVLLNENFKRKYQAAYGREPDAEITVGKVARPRKYVTQYRRGIYITAWYGEFRLRGTPEALDFLYQTGLGSRNSQGFGMFDVR